MSSLAERRGQRPPSLLLEQRSLRPGGPLGAPDDAQVVPNANVPGAVPPGTVGANAYTPGDPNGLEIIDGGPGAPWPRSTIRASPWSGYPSTWDTPLWNGGSGGSKFESLVDTAWMCLDLNASIMSTMPPYVVKGDEVIDPPLWMENPDPDLYTSWEEFAKQLFWDYQTGEAFVLPTARYADGYPARFHVVPGWLVNVEMDAGARRYHVGTLDVTDEILHIRYKSTTDDAHGHGPLEVGRTRMIAAAVLARYAQTVAEGGGVPYYALTSEDDLTEKQTNDLLDQWWLSRTQRLGMPAVFSGGVKVETLQFSPKDQALVELAQFNESRIAVLIGVPPFLVGLPSGGDSMTYQCLDVETEILTRDGWRFYDEMAIGAEVLTLNHDTGLSEWQAVQDLSFFDIDDDVLVMESRAHSSLSTLNHRWPVVKRNGERIWVTSKDLNGEHQIVLAARCNDLPGQAKYADAFVETVAWFTTEGYVYNRSGRRRFSTIAQSMERNPDNVEAIRAALTALFGPGRVKGDYDHKYVRHFGDEPCWVEDHTNKNGMVSFRLNEEATNIVLTAIGGDPFTKAVSFDWLLTLTFAQLHLYIETCIAADGSVVQGRGNQRVFVQKERSRIESFRFACTLAGVATSEYPRTGSDCTTIGVKVRSVYNPNRGVVTPPTVRRWVGRVWCPTLPNGTWYARRHGREFFTGNTTTSLFDFHWRASLRTKAQPVMAALSQWGLVRGTNAELDRDEYVRPALDERATAYATLHGIEDGTGLVLSAEEIRRRERFNRRRGDRPTSLLLPPTSIEVPTS